MCAHKMPFSRQKRKSPYIILNLQLWDFSKGLKNEFVVNKPSVLEPMKFHCIYMQKSGKLFLKYPCYSLFESLLTIFDVLPSRLAVYYNCSPSIHVHV